MSAKIHPEDPINIIARTFRARLTDNVTTNFRVNPLAPTIAFTGTKFKGEYWDSLSEEDPLRRHTLTIFRRADSPIVDHVVFDPEALQIWRDELAQSDPNIEDTVTYATLMHLAGTVNLEHVAEGERVDRYRQNTTMAVALLEEALDQCHQTLPTIPENSRSVRAQLSQLIGR